MARTNKLVLVSGIQYSGKSMFCRDLADRCPLLHHIEMDEGVEAVQNMNLIARLLHAYRPGMYQNERRKFQKKGVQLTNRQLAQTLLAYVASHEGAEALLELYHLCGWLVVGERVRICWQKRSVPMVDAVIPSRFARGFCCESIGHVVGERQMRRAHKLLVYFNFGIDYSLKQLRKSPQRPEKHTHVDSKEIMAAFSEQQLPEARELPNCKHVIVTSPSEMETVAQFVLAFANEP